MIIQLWGAAKPSDINEIQIFQSKCLCQIIKASFYVPNDSLHRDLYIPTVQNLTKYFINTYTLISAIIATP